MESDGEDDLLNFKSLKRIRSSKQQDDDAHLTKVTFFAGTSSTTNKKLNNSKLRRKSLQRHEWGRENKDKSSRKSLEPLPPCKYGKGASVLCSEKNDNETRLAVAVSLVSERSQQLHESVTDICGIQHDTVKIDLTNDKDRKEASTETLNTEFVDCVRSENDTDSDNPSRTWCDTSHHYDKVENPMRKTSKERHVPTSSDILLTSPLPDGSKTIADGLKQKRSLTRKTSPVLPQDPERAAPFEMSKSSTGNEKFTAPSKDEGIEAEESRCPFCQMPFRALDGRQWLNWHTMECMDTPLNATEGNILIINNDIIIKVIYIARYLTDKDEHGISLTRVSTPHFTKSCQT